MPRRATKAPRGTVIDFNTVDLYRDYIVVWFANVATHYLIGSGVDRVRPGDLVHLCNKANDYVSTLRKSRERGEGKERGEGSLAPDVCEDVPLNLTPNDNREMLRLCSAVENICEASRGKVGAVALPTALSFEFTEYIRFFMPRPSGSSKKGENVWIALHMLGLAVLGAHIARAYELRRKGEIEMGYVYPNVPISSAIDFSALHGMVKSVVSSVVRGNGGRLPMLCGVASAIVLNYGSRIREAGNFAIESVRTLRSGNKVMLKAFETLDITDLARTIFRLGLASAIYSLTSKYPAVDTKEARLAKSFVERLSRAVITYYGTGDLQELYGALRSLSSENVLNSLETVYGNRWGNIYKELIEVKVM